MYRGWNAVLQAVDNGDTQILKLLAERGHPDLDARDENGRSVLEIMDERGLKEEEDILLHGETTRAEKISRVETFWASGNFWSKVVLDL